MGITREQAADCFASDDLIGIGMEADAVRRRLHPENVVTYLYEEAADEAVVASLTIGVGETAAELVERLDAIRTQQEKGGGFAAFTLETVAGPEEPTAVEYLRTLAICRLYLDNIPHVQTSVAMGLKVLQMALRFGSNDIGVIPTAQKNESEEDLRRVIRDAGFEPRQRDAGFCTVYLN